MGDGWIKREGVALGLLLANLMERKEGRFLKKLWCCASGG